MILYTNPEWRISTLDELFMVKDGTIIKIL